MEKRLIFPGLVLILLFSVSLTAFSQETLTITTYYPAPYGVYQDMIIHGRIAIGNANQDPQGTIDNNDLAIDATGQPLEGALTIGNNIGIGTNAPLYPLDINRTYSPDPGRNLGIRTQGSILAEYNGDVGLALHSTASVGKVWSLFTVASNTPEGRFGIKQKLLELIVSTLNGNKSFSFATHGVLILYPN